MVLKQRLFSTLAAASALALLGCASPGYYQPTGGAYPASAPVSNAGYAQFGRVADVRFLQGNGSSGVAGTVIGGAVGGLAGHQVGGGSGKTAATVAGAVAGGVIGNQVDQRHVGGKVDNRTERQCHTENATSESSRVTGYTVTYRNPDGTTGTMRMDSKPGTRIAMGTTDKVIGYDVTYRFEGQDKTIRMDQKPGERLPVIDGQVVTQTASVDAPGQG